MVWALPRMTRGSRACEYWAYKDERWGDWLAKVAMGRGGKKVHAFFNVFHEELPQGIGFPLGPKSCRQTPLLNMPLFSWSINCKALSSELFFM